MKTTRLLLSFAFTILLASLLAGPASAQPSGPGPGNSVNAKACQKGGWRTLFTATGERFTSEGQCMRYSAAGGTLLTSPPPTRTLTVSKDGSGSGTVSGTGIDCGSDCTEGYADGTSVTLTATAGTGSTFAGWSGDCTGQTCVVTMTANRTVTATFDTTPPATRTLTVSKGGSGSGTVTGTGIDCGSDCTEDYTAGTTVTLTAAPDTGSTFAGWSNACTGQTCVVTMNADATAVADFTLTPSSSLSHVVDVAGMGDGDVLVLSIDDGSSAHVRRFSPNGDLDTTFADDGVLDPSNTISSPRMIAVRPNGQGFVLGKESGADAGGACGESAAVAQFSDGGVPDGTFGTGGLACVEFTDFDLRDVAVQQDGHVLALGTVAPSGSTSRTIGLARLDSVGTVDHLISQASSQGEECAQDQGEELGLMPDGDVIVAGLSFGSCEDTGDAVVLSRYDGSSLGLDPNFGEGGVAVESALFGGDQPRAPLELAIQPDGEGMAVAFTTTHAGAVDTIFTVEQLLFDTSGRLADSPVDVQVPTEAGVVGLRDLVATATGYVAVGNLLNGNLDNPQPDEFAIPFGQEFIDALEPLVVSRSPSAIDDSVAGLVQSNGGVLVVSMDTNAIDSQYLFNRLMENTATDPRSVVLDTTYGQEGFIRTAG